MTKKTKMRSKRTSRGLERTFHTTIAMATKTRMTYKVKDIVGQVVDSMEIVLMNCQATYDGNENMLLILFAI
jgi:hypothetical protein